MATVRVTRQRMLVSRTSIRPFKNYYEAEASDGRRFTNDSIVTLRQVLRRHYGRDVEIIETWKENG
jgi:hypothetical protein